MCDELSARIDGLDSRHEIEALVSNYCHGFDKRDFERLQLTSKPRWARFLAGLDF